MTRTSIIPVPPIISLRRAAARISRFPDHGPEGWRKSPIDPMDLLAIFRPLRLKPGFVLRAYVFREDGNGNGLAYAMPVDAPFLEPGDCPRAAEHFLEPPVPPGALPDVMQVIEGVQLTLVVHVRVDIRA